MGGTGVLEALGVGSRLGVSLGFREDVDLRNLDQPAGLETSLQSVLHVHPQTRPPCKLKP